MTKLVVASPWIFAIQNTLAALVFAGLLATQCLDYLLYLQPGTELLWALTIPANRLAGPLLQSIDLRVGMGPLAMFCILGCAVLLPVIAQLRRSRLGTSMAGHLALGAILILTTAAMSRALGGRGTASLSPIFDPAIYNSDSTSLTIATVVMVVLCVLNHAVFLRRESK